MITHDYKFDIKSINDEGQFEGLLSVYDNVDEGDDLVEAGAFTKTISEHSGEIPALWQHREPVGLLRLEDSANALKVTGQLVMAVARAREAHALMKARVVKGLSIGYEAIKWQMDQNVRRIKEARLFEGSIVTFPMNPLAQITSVKSHAELDAFIEELKAGRQLSATKRARVLEIVDSQRALTEKVLALLNSADAGKVAANSQTEPDNHSDLMLLKSSILEVLNERGN